MLTVFRFRAVLVKYTVSHWVKNPVVVVLGSGFVANANI
jgi:hypothetical protein